MTVARAYASEMRLEAAKETRARLIETATRLLITEGVAGMTIAALAKEAGVSPQTVYNSVGSKAEVIKAAYDVALAGDDDPTPMSERPAFRAIQEASDIESYAAAYAHWSAGIYERVGPLLSVLLFHGSGGDPLLEEFIGTINRERRTGNGHGVTALRERRILPAKADLERLIDGVWACTAPENWNRLVQQRGWNRAQYEAWLAGQLVATLKPAG